MPSPGGPSPYPSRRPWRYSELLHPGSCRQPEECGSADAIGSGVETVTLDVLRCSGNAYRAAIGAVEFAKRFGSGQSAQFASGILDKFLHRNEGQ
jgi:hypothetical protein